MRITTNGPVKIRLNDGAGEIEIEGSEGGSEIEVEWNEEKPVTQTHSKKGERK